MKARFIKSDKMLSRLKSIGINLHLRETVARDGEKRSSFDFTRQFFTLSGLNEEALHLIRSRRLPQNRNSVLVNGSSSNCRCTSVAKPSMPFRRSV